MTTTPQSPDGLTDLLLELQRRARALHGDATDRLIRAKVRALSVQMRHISAGLRTRTGLLAQIIASDLIEAVTVVLKQLEGEAARRPRLAR